MSKMEEVSNELHLGIYGEPDSVNMAEQLSKAEQKLVENIAIHFFYKKYPPSNDPLAYNFRWGDIPFDGCPSSKPFYTEAVQIHNIYKEAGYQPEIDANAQLEYFDKCFENLARNRGYVKLADIISYLHRQGNLLTEKKLELIEAIKKMAESKPEEVKDERTN